MASSIFTPLPVPSLTSSGLLLQLNCAPTVTVGDLVVQSVTVDETAETVTSNVFTGLVLGVVIAKPSSTLCNIRTIGRAPGYSGLVRGKPVFVDATGAPTTTVPTPPYHHQVLGVALSATEFYLFPQTQKVIRI